MEALNYTPDKEKELMALEYLITQGKNIRLKINKTHFLQRAGVFKTYNPCIIERKNKIIGSGIVSISAITLAGVKENAGFAFDLKVHPKHRGEGVGKYITRTGLNHIINEFRLEKVFTTLKSVNVAVAKIAARTSVNRFFYPFVYLTIPSETIITEKNMQHGFPSLFTVGLNNAHELDSKYYFEYKDGLGFFRTHLLYTITVDKITPLLKYLLNILRVIHPKKYKRLPKEGQTFSTSLIYGLNQNSFTHLPEVFRRINEEKTDFIMVCCRKGDVVYRALRSYSINQAHYLLASNFKIKDGLPVEIDARCC